MATITNLQGSTQIWNSDEIINANFQSINNSIVEKTGNQTIAGDKTFTAVEMIHDVTSNTEAPNMRRAVKRTKVKNIWDAWGVEFVEYVDADNSVVWFRKRALRGYLKKWATWATASFNELFAIEYDTYDGDATYTSRTSIKTDSLYFNDQNWTGAWTNWTPTRTGGITTSVFSIFSSSYKQIGKTMFLQAFISITPSSSWSSISISPPVLWASWTNTPLSTRVWGLIDSQSQIDSTAITFDTNFVSGTPIAILFSWSYPTG